MVARFFMWMEFITGMGKNKEKTTGERDIWHWGVRCYASTDLYNWEDKGLIIPPDLKDPESPIHPTSMMDSPHIIYNKKTKKYVCWLKIMEIDGTQTETVFTADNILEPYEIVRKDWYAIEKYVAENDPYHHLLSNHNCFSFYDFTRPNITHCCVQTIQMESATKWIEKYKKPLIYDECCYEGNLPFSWGNLSGFEMVNRFWQTCVPGAYASHRRNCITGNC